MSTVLPSPTPLTKAVAVLAITGVALLVTGLYMGVDWMQTFPNVVANVPAYAGYARTVLCAGVAFMVGRNCVGSRDRLLLMAAFGVTLAADYFLVLTGKHFLVGVGLFLVVHILLTLRHAQGFRASLAPERRARTLRLLAITAVIAFSLTGVVLWNVAGILKRSGQEVVDVIYVLALTVSMWMGWGTLIRDTYPRLNAWFIAVGITHFYCCDVSVGLVADLPPGTLRSILDDMVGVFYTPALVLLALSGYRWAGTRAAATVHSLESAAPASQAQAS
ncbi:lysoplasmalogenase family protein [Pyxidicoccus sp. 3LG]